MKNEKFEEMVLNAGMIELSDEQLLNTDGGFIVLLLEAAGLYAAICAVAYGAGALYGLATK